MNPQIDQAALDAASAGPHPPPANRLRAAAEYVAARSGADQLILFGSAARGGFGERSDFDFIAVGPNRKRPAGESDRWNHPKTGDWIDVLFTDAKTIEDKRWTAGTVYCTAMAEGTTVFVAQDAERVLTARDAGVKGTTMVKREHLVLTEAPVFAKQAAAWLKTAKLIMNEEPAVGCKQLQESAERSLKALLIARGAPVTHIHGLREAWEELEALGERFDIKKNDKLLNEMSLYGGKKGYGTPSGWDPKEVAETFAPIAEGLSEHAARRVPELLDEHERRREAGGAAGPGGPDRG